MFCGRTYFWSLIGLSLMLGWFSPGKPVDGTRLVGGTSYLPKSVCHWNNTHIY